MRIHDFFIIFWQVFMVYRPGNNREMTAKGERDMESDMQQRSMNHKCCNLWLATTHSSPIHHQAMLSHEHLQQHEQHVQTFTAV